MYDDVMKKYLVLLDWVHEGCDYTIWCNMKWIEIEADSIDDVEFILNCGCVDKKEIDAQWDSLLDYYGEDCPVVLYRVIEIAKDYWVVDYKERSEEIIESRNKQAKENKERAEYKMLKQKYS